MVTTSTQPGTRTTPVIGLGYRATGIRGAGGARAAGAGAAGAGRDRPLPPDPDGVRLRVLPSQYGTADGDRRRADRRSRRPDSATRARPHRQVALGRARQGLPRVSDRRHQAPDAPPGRSPDRDGAEQGWRCDSATTPTATSTSTDTTGRCSRRSSPTGPRRTRARDIIDRLRAVKSETELQFIIESCTWGNLAHRLMQEKIELGRNEMDISFEASTEAARMMIAALGPTYQPLTAVWSTPVLTMFHAGANTVLPHGLSNATGSAAATSSSPAPPPTSPGTTPNSSGQ